MCLIFCCFCFNCRLQQWHSLKLQKHYYTYKKIVIILVKTIILEPPLTIIFLSLFYYRGKLRLWPRRYRRWIRWFGLRQGSRTIRRQGCGAGFCKALPSWNQVGSGWNLRQRGMYPQEVDAPGIPAGRSYPCKCICVVTTGMVAGRFLFKIWSIYSYLSVLIKGP